MGDVRNFSIKIMQLACLPGWSGVEKNNGLDRGQYLLIFCVLLLIYTDLTLGWTHPSQYKPISNFIKKILLWFYETEI